MCNSRIERQSEIGDRDNLMPIHESNWACTVPQWEKQFCYTVGTIPWRRFLEMKRYIHLYENVVNWDDSAGEEAFNSAKNRFRAKINGLQCDNNVSSLLNSNLYIDEVDWDSRVDPNLILDLETEPEFPLSDNQSPCESNPVALTEALLTSQSFSCSGWGEIDQECPPRLKESRIVPLDRSYKSRLDEPSRRNKKATGWYDSRFKASRFPVSYECRANRAASFAHEKHVLRQWAMKS